MYPGVLMALCWRERDRQSVCVCLCFNLIHIFISKAEVLTQVRMRGGTERVRGRMCEIKSEEEEKEIQKFSRPPFCLSVRPPVRPSANAICEVYIKHTGGR